MHTTTGRRRERASKPAEPPRPASRAAGERSRSRATLAPATLTADQILFERYRLERRIGSGGVADVWRATDLRLDRRVAIKILHPHHLPNETWRRRLVAEARSASGLSHPGIVPVYDVLDDSANPAIVFQLVDGESLDDRLHQVGALPLPEATSIAAQVAGALEHAHRAGVIHRDVKPANIVVDGEGRARLVDFGIARVIEDAGAEVTGEHEVVGTLRYMAPEQLRGEAADARTDLYALGLVIAEMVPDLDAAPGWLRELVDRLRAPDPADRPESAGDVARALDTGNVDGGTPSEVGTATTATAAAPGTPADDLVDPDAVTRTFDARPEPAASITEPAIAAPAVAEAAPAGAVPTAPEPATAPAVPRRQRSRVDNRPIVVVILVAGLALGGLALSRSDLFGAASGGNGAANPSATVAPAPTAGPADTGPNPKKGHGRGPH